MRITLGLDSSDQDNITSFVKDGADEFFAGFTPPEWYNRYGWEVGLNRRNFGPQNQFTKYEALDALIRAVHSCGKKIFITLNAHQYCDEQVPLIKEIISRLEVFNPDGYIVADPALMIMMRQWGISRPFHLSTGAACFNSQSLRYFCGKFGIDRAILPRKMSLKEMEMLIRKSRDLQVEFEAMIIAYRCYFNDEYCFTWHSGVHANFCFHFGMSQKFSGKVFPETWKETVEDILKNHDSQFKENSPLDQFVKEMTYVPRKSEAIQRVEEADSEGKGYRGMHRRLAQEMFKNCGLCAIPRLKNIGVAALKIPVRGEIEMKRKYIQAVRKVIDNPQADRAFCQALINSPGFCRENGNCYYCLEE